MPLLIGFVILHAVQCIHAAAGAYLQPRQAASIPGYVNTYAPLVYLDQNELYLPSDLQAQLNHTFLALNYTAATNAPSPLSLLNLDQLNGIGKCTISNFDACPLYLTSKDNVTSNPQWLYGVLPDPMTHATTGAKSCAIIVNDHNNGVVDAFYMYFYAFNQGNTVNGQLLGDHVGDWEHTMVRFTNGTPTAVWFSQHDSGQAFIYSALSKNGTRPIVYSAIGSHANYPVPGTHSRTIATVVVNDTTSAGPLWDPTLSAYYYTYTPTSPVNGTFTAADPSTPVAWLSFLGRWGDERYPDSDPRQVNFLNLGVSWKYESGPTGPLNKNLNRTEVCPDSGKGCTTLSGLPAVSGSSVPVTVSRSSATGSSSSGAATMTATSSATASSTMAASAGTSNISGGAPALMVELCVVWTIFAGAVIL